MEKGCDSEWSVTIDLSEDVDGIVNNYSTGTSTHHYLKYFNFKVSDSGNPAKART